MKLKIKKFLHRNIYPMLIYVFPIKTNKIVFSSYAGKQYSGNPRAISEMLHKLYPEFDIVWLMEDDVSNHYDLPNYIRIVNNESFLAAYELYTARIWVDNCRKALFFKKRKKQYYIQTWHGTPLKLMEADAGNKLGSRYRKYAMRDTKNIDYLISGNTYSTKIFKRAFKYNGEILEHGTPRNDILLNMTEETRLKLRKKIGCDREKIILYAPTFRDNLIKNGEKQIELLDPISLLESFEKKYEDEYILLTRFHPNVANKINIKDTISRYKGRVKDLSIGWDMQELLSISDVLITDYSSVFFDYAILHKPIFLFTPDEKDYYKERGLYIGIKELPIFFAQLSEELIKLVLTKDLEELINNTINLLDQIGNKEIGNSTVKIVELIKRLSKKP